MPRPARDRAGRALTFLNKQVFFYLERALQQSLRALCRARGPREFFLIFRAQAERCSLSYARPPRVRARGHIYILSRALQSVSYARPRVRAAAF